MAAVLSTPSWWDEDCETILRFVRQHRLDNNIEVGSPIPDLGRESEIGYYLFGMLAHTQEYGAYWHDLYEDDILRKMVLNRIATRPRAVA